jgi:hypothetical protein
MYIHRINNGGDAIKQETEMFEVQFMIGDLVTGTHQLKAKTLLAAKREVNSLTWSGDYNGNNACIYADFYLVAHGVVKRVGKNDAKVKDWTNLGII